MFRGICLSVSSTTSKWRLASACIYAISSSVNRVVNDGFFISIGRCIRISANLFESEKRDYLAIVCAFYSFLWKFNKPLTFNSFAYLSILAWSLRTIASQNWHNDNRTEAGSVSYKPWSRSTISGFPDFLFFRKNTEIIIQINLYLGKCRILFVFTISWMWIGMNETCVENLLGKCFE